MYELSQFYLKKELQQVKSLIEIKILETRQDDQTNILLSNKLKCIKLSIGKRKYLFKSQVLLNHMKKRESINHSNENWTYSHHQVNHTSSAKNQNQLTILVD